LLPLLALRARLEWGQLTKLLPLMMMIMILLLRRLQAAGQGQG
jgi:hypothetical protein